jgi:hypothetical protein
MSTQTPLEVFLAEYHARHGLSLNGSGPGLADDFWIARTALDHIRQAAHARQCSAPYLVHVVLARVAAAIPHTIELPPIIGAPRPLCYFTVGFAPSGVGKTNVNDVAAELVPIDDPEVADQLPLGSGEGLAEILFEWVTENDEDGKLRQVKRQTRHGAFVFVDEGQMLTDLGRRSGSTLLPVLRTIWSGGTIGNTNASRDARRIVPAGQYTFGVAVGLQPHLAGALLDDADAGTPQRFCMAYAIDPTIPDVEPSWPGPLNWQPPGVRQLERIEIRGAYIRHRLDVDPEIFTQVREAGRARARGEIIVDPLDAHGTLLRLKTAGLLAILDGRLDIGAEDWHLADTLKKYSDTVRTDVVATTKQAAAEREAATTRRLTNRRLHAEAAVETRRIIDCARRIATKVHNEPERWTFAELRRDLRRWRDVFVAAIDHAKDEGWIVEIPESGQGADKRPLRPGPRRPA